MLKNAYLLAKIGADTAENERNLSKICNYYPTGPRAPPLLLRPVDRRGVEVLDAEEGVGAQALHLGLVLALS